MAITIKDVAVEAGVSIATVSHVLNGTRVVMPETSKKVLSAMDRLGYSPNALANCTWKAIFHPLNFANVPGKASFISCICYGKTGHSG